MREWWAHWIGQRDTCVSSSSISLQPVPFVLCLCLYSSFSHWSSGPCYPIRRRTLIVICFLRIWHDMQYSVWNTGLLHTDLFILRRLQPRRLRLYVYIQKFKTFELRSHRLIDALPILMVFNASASGIVAARPRERIVYRDTRMVSLLSFMGLYLTKHGLKGHVFSI